MNKPEREELRRLCKKTELSCYMEDWSAFARVAIKLIPKLLDALDEAERKLAEAETQHARDLKTALANKEIRP